MEPYRKSEETGKPIGENMHYLLEMYCQSSIYLTIKWVLGEMKSTPEELACLLVEGMPGRLSDLFAQVKLLE